MSVTALGGRHRVLIDGVDFSVAVRGELIVNQDKTSQTGIVFATLKFQLVQSRACPESIDPRENPDRWQIGNLVRVRVTVSGDPNGVLLHTLYIRTRPVYDEYAKTLDIDAGCQLSFRDTKQPQGEVTGIDPVVGMSRNEVIELLLQASGIENGLTGAGPDGTLYYPPQKFGDDAYLRTAGEIAFSAPNGPWFLYCDRFDFVRCKRWADVTQYPAFTVNHREILDTQLLRGDEYIKPFERVKCTGTQLTICGGSFTNPPPVETFAPYNSLVGGGNTAPVLVKGVYTTRTLNGNVFTEHVETKTAFVTTLSSVQTNTIQPVYTLKLSSIVDITATFDNSGDPNSIDPEDWPTTYILSRTTIEQGLRSTGITQTYNSAILTEAMRPVQRTTETWTYTDKDQIATYKKAVDQPLGDLFPIVVPPIGTGNVIPTAYQGTPAMTDDWVPVTEVIQEWTNSGCGEDGWTLKTTNRINAGLLNASSSRYQLVDQSVQTTPNSPPPEPERQPLPYSTKEEQIEGLSTFKPRNVTVFYDTERTVEIPFPDDVETLEILAQWLQKQDYGYAAGRNFQLPLIPKIINAIAACPFGRFDYVNELNQVRSYEYTGLALSIDQRKSLWELDAPLIGFVPTAPITINGGSINGFNLSLVTPGQPVVFYGQSVIGGVFDPGVVYYASPNGSGGITVSATPGGPPITPTNTNTGGATVGVPGQTDPPFAVTVTVNPTLILGAEFSATPPPPPAVEFNSTLILGATFEPFAVTATLILGASFSPNPSGVRSITGFSPVSGAAGTMITITGQNLTGATTVKINGTSATNLVAINATTLQAVVDTSTTSGLIEVILPSGSVFSNSPFIVNSTGGGGGSGISKIYTFDLARQFIQLTAENYTQFTLAGWIKSNYTVANQILISKNSFFAATNTDFPFQLLINTNGTLTAQIDAGGDFVPDKTITLAGVNALDNQWHFFAVTTFEGGNCRIRLDDTTITDTMGNMSDNTRFMSIGDHPFLNGGGTSQQFFGQLANWIFVSYQMSNTALTNFKDKSNPS